MPYPWSVNDILTAADLNAAIGTGIVSTGLTPLTYTPVVTQSNTPTMTVEYAKYQVVGGWCHVLAHVAITGAGTAANAVRISLPVASTAFRCLGTGGVYDASVNTYYSGAAFFISGTVVQFIANAQTIGIGAASMTAALAAGDLVFMDLSYPIV